MGKKLAPGNSHPDRQWAVFLATFISDMISKVGLTGTILIGWGVFIWKHSTSAQKVEIINTYALFQGPWVPPVIYVGGFFLLLMYIQRTYFQKRVHFLEVEVARLSKERNTNQQGQLKKPVHSSQP